MKVASRDGMRLELSREPARFARAPRRILVYRQGQPARGGVAQRPAADGPAPPAVHRAAAARGRGQLAAPNLTAPCRLRSTSRAAGVTGAIAE